MPRSPISPNIRRDVMVALGGGIFFAFGLAFLFEYMDNRIKSPQELKAHIGVPFLGMVPVIKGNSDPLLSDDVAANFAEAFKAIRTNVLFSSADEGMRSLVVTSAAPAKARRLSSNLAIALGQTGQRVLLIDADMRRPRVHEIFGGNQEPGLSNVLTGNAKASDAIRRSQIAGLWLLSSGHIPPNPAELFGSRRFADFMISLGDHFDWVIIDTPPVLAVTDSSIVANQASGVVFVVGADKTSKHAARVAVEQLDAATHIVGSVLNRVDLVRNPHYYSSYYRKEREVLREECELADPSPGLHDGPRAEGASFGGVDHRTERPAGRHPVRAHADPRPAAAGRGVRPVRADQHHRRLHDGVLQPRVHRAHTARARRSRGELPGTVHRRLLHPGDAVHRRESPRSHCILPHLRRSRPPPVMSIVPAGSP